MQEKRIAELLKLLAAMKSALPESEEVAHIVGEMETCGVKVMLVVDAVLQAMDQRSGLRCHSSSVPNLNYS